MYLLFIYLGPTRTTLILLMQNTFTFSYYIKIAFNKFFSRKTRKIRGFLTVINLSPATQLHNVYIYIYLLVYIYLLSHYSNTSYYRKSTNQLQSSQIPSINGIKASQCAAAQSAKIARACLSNQFNRAYIYMYIYK